MQQASKPSPRIEPLPPEHSPELSAQFEAVRANLGFIPNSVLIMQCEPKLVRAPVRLIAAVWDAARG